MPSFLHNAPICSRSCLKLATFIFLTLILAFNSASLLLAQDDEECLACHGERDFVAEKDGKSVSLYVSVKRFTSSTHGEIGCVSCHMDADAEHFLRDEPLASVDCEMCHSEAIEEFNRSLHGTALRAKKYLAPTCLSCHGKHDIKSASNPDSRTYVRNIPSLCGSCHKEGTAVSELRDVEEHQALEDYSQSIHGDGLFKRGLIVTAVCTSCHNSHLILPHEDSDSSINQAKAFNEMIGIDGIIITKLDGTAKGGSVLSIADELKMPIFYIGTGEQPQDLISFKANEYVNSILDEIFV